MESFAAGTRLVLCSTFTISVLLPCSLGHVRSAEVEDCAKPERAPQTVGLVLPLASHSRVPSVCLSSCSKTLNSKTDSMPQGDSNSHMIAQLPAGRGRAQEDTTDNGEEV